MNIQEELTENVERGVQHLRAKYGEGWADEINIQDFDMNKCDRCIIGQLEGFFTINRVREFREMHDLGFYYYRGIRNDKATDEETQFAYNILNELWKKQIIKAQKS